MDRDRFGVLEIFTAMDKVGWVDEEQKVKVENLNGDLMIIGAYDHVIWPT